ncbi:MAG: hypothetical protein Q4E53_04475 [Eubacteriales bacterium]|nr:hypothetical protein [Eubacteriales bacterium]
MRKMKSIVAVVMAAAMAFGMVGCGGSDTGAAESTGAATAVASDSDLNVMIETPVESLDPQLATDGTSFEVIADYTDGLMQMAEDGTPVNAICESYEVSEDACM